MRHLFKVAVCGLDKPNLNGRVYSSEAMRQALAKVPPFVPIKRTVEAETTLPNIVGEAFNPRIEGGHLCFDVTIIDPALLEQVKTGAVGVRPSGTGTLNGTNVGPDYRIDSLFLTDRPA